MAFGNLKLTRIKLGMAKILYRMIKIFYRDDIRTVTRKGISFELDLREGIDLHTFLFGGFQKHVYHNDLIKIAPNDMILDVGGNIGVMSLFFAKQSKNGFVYSFEPTYYAADKFRKNLSLNPDLAKRIELTQCFVSRTSEPDPQLVAYSSWPVEGDEEKHEIHCGVSKNADHIPAISPDDFVTTNKIKKIDLIKIDTDGHEYQVLQGAENILRTLRPKIIFEIGLYIMQEKNIRFEDYDSFFQPLNYRLYTVKGKEVTVLNYKKHIPRYGTVDLIAGN